MHDDQVASLKTGSNAVFFFRKNQPGLFFPRRKSRLDNCQKITQTGQIIRNNRVHQNNPPGYFLDFFPRRFFRLKVSGKITRRVIFYLARAKKPVLRSLQSASRAAFFRGWLCCTLLYCDILSDFYGLGHPQDFDK